MLHPRARTMLLLSLPAVAIGIASSLILIVVMKIASVLQNLLWQRLPGTLGIGFIWGPDGTSAHRFRPLRYQDLS